MTGTESDVHRISLIGDVEAFTSVPVPFTTRPNPNREAWWLNDPLAFAPGLFELVEERPVLPAISGPG